MFRKDLGRRRLPLMLLVPMLVLGACLKSSPPPAVPADRGLRAEDEAWVKQNQRQKQDLADCRAQQVKLEQTLKEGQVPQRSLEEAVGSLKLLLLEKETQIKGMEGHQTSLQKKLDEAIQEVVRAKAKLRSHESRAEAASHMAETEVAIKVLRSQRPEQEQAPELAKAEQLLGMSTQEFKKENYGGALYLAYQAKEHIRLAQTQHRGEEEGELLSGEVLFAVPLALQVMKTSNVREGPGLSYKVITSVGPNTSVTGYSYKGQWVRVEGENDLKGWIHQSLLGGR